MTKQFNNGRLSIGNEKMIKVIMYDQKCTPLRQLESRCDHITSWSQFKLDQKRNKNNITRSVTLNILIHKYNLNPQKEGGP